MKGLKQGRLESGLCNESQAIPRDGSHDTHSSPRKNSAVRKRCSRVREADKTPPYSSVSRAVFNAEPSDVD